MPAELDVQPTIFNLMETWDLLWAEKSVDVPGYGPLYVRHYRRSLRIAMSLYADTCVAFADNRYHVAGRPGSERAVDIFRIRRSGVTQVGSTNELPRLSDPIELAISKLLATSCHSIRTSRVETVGEIMQREQKALEDQASGC